MNLQLDIFGGRNNRDAGMSAAVGHANKVISNWEERAYKCLLEFIEKNPDAEFMGEDVRKYAYGVKELPLAPDQRSWGAILVRAKKSGVIKKVGLGPVKNSKANRANAGIWKKSK